MKLIVAGLSIFEWLGLLLAGAVALIVLMVWIGYAVRTGVAEALPEHVGRLERIGRTADEVVDRLGVLDTWLRAENHATYRLSVVQTLYGTLIGLLAGFGSDWIVEGGALRIVAALVVGVVLVVAGPPLTVRLFAGVGTLLGPANQPRTPPGERPG